MDQRGIADLGIIPPIKFWATGNVDNSRKCEGASASVPPPLTPTLRLLGQLQCTHAASP